MDQHIARVSAVYKDTFSVVGEFGTVPAEVTGKLAYMTSSHLDFPVVGDQVNVRYLDQNTFAIIVSIHPRNSLLKRKTAGKKSEYQAIAANIDTGFIVQALDHDFNINRLERYLVMLHECSIAPIILLSKADLVSHDTIASKTEALSERVHAIPIIVFSNSSKLGCEKIKHSLQANKTYCLLGSSGVGKTTLLNYLLDEERFAVQTVSKKEGKGKHTTSNRQLIQLSNQAFIIDTPGMRELGQIEVQEGLCTTFEDIVALSALCKYDDCTHTIEQGCGVQGALMENQLSIDHYKNYLKLKKESAYHQMSYLEKKAKNKTLSKLVKQFGNIKKKDKKI